MAPHVYLNKRSLLALALAGSVAGFASSSSMAPAQIQAEPTDPIALVQTVKPPPKASASVKKIAPKIFDQDYVLPRIDRVPASETVDSGIVRVVGGKEYKLLQSTVEIGVGFSPGKSLNLPKSVHGKMTANQPAQGIAVVRLDGANKTTFDAALKALRGDPQVKYAYPVLVDATARTRVIVTNEIVVAPTDQKAVGKVAADLAAKGLSRVSGKDSKAGSFLVFEVDEADTTDPMALEEVLSALPGIEWAEVNLFKQIEWQYTPNDPDYALQWHLNNTGQQGLAKPGADISAPEAWDTTLGDENVVIAIIDTGVEPGHPDLADNMWVNEQELNGTPGIDDDGNGYVDDIYGYDFYNNTGDPSPTGDEAHGMGCAGIAAAVINNATGRAGGANVSIMGLKIGTEFSDGSASFVDDVTTASIYEYAYMNGADILSNSYSVSPPSTTMSTAISAVKTNGRGGLGSVFFAASGNSASHWAAANFNLTGAPDGTYHVSLFYEAGSGAASPAAELALDDVVFGGILSNVDPSLAASGWYDGFGLPLWQDYSADPYATGPNAMANPALAAGAISSSTFPATVTVSGGALTMFARYRYKGPASGPRLLIQLDSTIGPDAYAFAIPAASLATLTQNPSTAVSYPANYVDSIAVGASSDNDYRSNYSQYGPEIAFLAPSNGGWLPTYSLNPTGAVGGAGDYMTFGGTSSATPQAAGVAALALSFNPTLTHDELIAAMKNSADKIGPLAYAKQSTGRNDQYGHGRLNAATLIQLANEAPNGLEIDNNIVPENEPAGTLVGTLSTLDVNQFQTFTYTLNSTGVPFEIVGDELRTTAPLDYETKSYYLLDISTTDSGTPGLTYRVEFFFIDVGDVPEQRLVTTLLDEDDGGLGLGAGDSLREVLDAAGEGDTIDFDPSLYDGNTKINQAAQILLTDTLTVASSVTINGPGPDVIELVADSGSANYPFRIMDIWGEIVTIYGLGFRDGWAEGTGPMARGGAINLLGIEVFSLLTIEFCDFYNNRAVGHEDSYASEALGGAVSFASEGELVITDCIFIANEVSGDLGSGLGGGGGKQLVPLRVRGGGALFIGGPELSGQGSWDTSFTVEFSFFLSNRESGTGDTIGGGGAIWAAGEIVQGNIYGSDFYDNTSSGLPLLLGPGAVGGGAIALLDSRLSIQSSNIVGNSASGFGGGLMNSGGEINIIASGVANNGHPGPNAGMSLVGGGLYSAGQTLVVNSTISSNAAHASGGGIHFDPGGETVMLGVMHSAIVDNQVLEAGEYGGGGLFTAQSFAHVQNSIVAENMMNSDTLPVPSDILTLPTANLISGGRNIIGVNTGAETAFPEGNPNVNEDIVGSIATGLVDPLIGPLADYGNGAIMHGLLLGSPARDFANAAGGIVADQRGAPRSFKQIGAGAPDTGPYEVQDFDGDGILDDEENTVPSALSGIDPVTDGNGDGIVDSIQSNVASLRGASPTQDYMTLVVEDPLYFEGVYAEADPIPGLLDPDEFEYGFAGFDVNGLSNAGDEVLVRILYAEPLTTNRYYKVGPTEPLGADKLYTFMATGTTFPNNLGAVFVSPTEVELTLVDGAKGDADFIADQIIRDPGGPGVSEPLFVQIAAFAASAEEYGEPVLVAWSTAAEVDNAGFNVYEALPIGGGKFQVGARLNVLLIPSEATETSGADYTLIDANPISEGAERWYWLEAIDVSSGQSLHGPVQAIVGKETRVQDWMLLQ